MPERQLMMRSDPTRLQQILHNLVGNAIKYSPAGGDVHVDVAISDDAVQVTVTDQGIGIAPEELAHIFEPFRRASSGAMQGAGLGLFIVRQIAEAHGGRIDVVSRLGEGLQVHSTERHAALAPVSDIHTDQRQSLWRRTHGPEPRFRRNSSLSFRMRSTEESWLVSEQAG